VVGGLAAGAKLLHSNKMKPTPLTPPKRPVAKATDAAQAKPALGEAAGQPEPATTTSANEGNGP
jgi:hypothetical protein